MNKPKEKRVVSRPRKKRVVSSGPIKPSHQQRRRVRKKLHRPRAGQIESRSVPLVHPTLVLMPREDLQLPNRKGVGLQIHPRPNQVSRTETVGPIVAGLIRLHWTGETIRQRLVIPLREGPAALPARNVQMTLTTRKRRGSGPAKALRANPLRHEPGLRPPSRGRTARNAEAKIEANVAGALLPIPLLLTEAPASHPSRNHRMSPRQSRAAPLLRKLPPERRPRVKMEDPPVPKEQGSLTTKRSSMSDQRAVLPGILPRAPVTRKHAREEGITRCLPSPASRRLTITNPAQSHPHHQSPGPPIRLHRPLFQILPSLGPRIRALLFPLRRFPHPRSQPLPFPLQKWGILPNQPLQELLRQKRQKSPKRDAVMTEVLIVQTMPPPIPLAERTPKICQKRTKLLPARTAKPIRPQRTPLQCLPGIPAKPPLTEETVPSGNAVTGSGKLPQCGPQT